MVHGGRARGEMGGGGTREQCKVHWFLFWVGRWPMEGGQGGRWGGAPESSVGATKGALVPFFWAPSKT